MIRKILVIGATGVVGGQVAAALEQKGEPVRAATRRPRAAARQASHLREFVAFDFERPETFAPALRNVDRVFLIARPGDDDADRVAAPLIDEMKRQGVARVVHLSAMGAETRDDFSLRKVERYLEASGLAFTHLRPNWFMQIFSGGPLLADIRATGAIHIPAAGARLSFIDVRDLVAVAVAALTEPGHEGKAYTLTGGAALTHDQAVAAITAAAGRGVRYMPVEDDVARRALAAQGFSPARIYRLMEFYRLVRAGFCAPVSPDVEAVLGRPPIAFAQFAKDHAACWA